MARPAGCACATGSRAYVCDDGCSAGRSACPWPRWSLLNHPTAVSIRASTGRHRGPCKAAGRARHPEVPGSRPCRRRSGDCLRVPTCSLGQTSPCCSPVPNRRYPFDPPAKHHAHRKFWRNVAERLAPRNKPVNLRKPLPPSVPDNRASDSGSSGRTWFYRVRVAGTLQ